MTVLPESLTSLNIRKSRTSLSSSSYICFLENCLSDSMYMSILDFVLLNSRYSRYSVLLLFSRACKAGGKFVLEFACIEEVYKKKRSLVI